MNFTEINKALKSLENIAAHATLVETISDEDNNYDGKQEIYQLKEDDSVYLRLSYLTSSYDEEDYVSGVEFVTPTKVVITDFTPTV